ncbi:MAG TPA: GYD domain-containing protein [Silvibacterium sp.]|nr:GYD domain-containing protein [Silvibacterium sp.]
MPTYIAMLKWTAQGMKDVKQSPTRLEAARKGFQAAGVTMKQFYMVMGHHDLMMVVEAPDDATLAKAMLGAASQGGVTSETFRAFTEEEYRKIIGGLG